jgi:hypothetical protein
MKAIVYTHDLEPIVVTDLPEWALESGERRRTLAVPVFGQTLNFEFRTCLWKGRQRWRVVCMDEATSRAMAPSWEVPAIRHYTALFLAVEHAMLSILGAGPFQGAH